jgi:hypothetical protein
MNNNGQFLLYDAFLAFILILLVLIAMLYVFNQEEDNFPNYTKASDTLDFLSSITVNDMNLLVALSNNNLEAKRIVEDTLNGENYLLKDLTENKTLSGNRSQSDAICSRKIVDGHEYELLLYS